MPATTQLRSRDQFDSLGREDENSEDKNFRVEVSPALQEIGRQFKNYIKWLATSGYWGRSDRHDQKVVHQFIPSEYSSRDITNFSLGLPSHPREAIPYSGDYLDGLIAKLQGEEEITIFTKGLEEPPQIYYGNLNQKRVIVIGDVILPGHEMDGGKLSIYGDILSAKTGVFDGVGSSMRNGEIYVEGNALCGVGINMYGGVIRIKGDAWRAGHQMNSGEVIIGGSVLYDVGASMRGGKVTVMGDKPNVSNTIQGGIIYHRNRVIYDGRRIQ